MLPPDDSLHLPILDPERVICDMEGDVEAYREIATVFLQELNPTLEALDKAVQRDAHDDLIGVLHEAANSMGIVGASRGEARVRNLENDLYEDPSCVPAAVAGAVVRASLCASAAALSEWLHTGR